MDSTKYQIRELDKLEEMLEQYELVCQLHSWIKKDQYLQMLKEMIPHNYRQVGVFEGDKCLGLSGYWINTKFYSGKYLEPDNVIVDTQSRSKGVGKMLIDFLVEKAKAEGCKTVLLDAYVENKDGHRFYFREGFSIRGFHFLKKI